MLRGVLGVEAGEPTAPPTLEDIELPRARLEPGSSIASFTSTLHEARVRHTYGRAYPDIVRGFRGDFAGAPDLVSCPSTEEEIAAVLAWADQTGSAVIPFGGGTSVVGGVERDPSCAERAVLALDMRRLNRVLEVDERSRLARIQGGALGPELESQLGERGLTLRHYPQSFEFSTLGGWIATRAGGHFATVYTHIDDLVASTRTITPSGVIQTRTLPGSGAGPSPDRLVLGSEGTLGIVTEASMRVRPRPRFRASASVQFDEFERAVSAVRAIAQSGLFPTNCRLLDKHEALLNGVSMSGEHILVLGFESADHTLDASMARALELTADFGGRCPEGPVYRDQGEAASREGKAGQWRQSFFNGPYLQSALVTMSVIADTFETAIPWSRFESLHEALRERVGDTMRRVCGAGVLSCRFTHVYPDGPAPYYTFIAPGRAGAELEQWAAIKETASDTLIQQGATITHHHSVGRTHKRWYQAQCPDLFIDVLRAAKERLDPAGLLNPGVLIP